MSGEIDIFKFSKDKFLPVWLLNVGAKWQVSKEIPANWFWETEIKVQFSPKSSAVTTVAILDQIVDLESVLKVIRMDLDFNDEFIIKLLYFWECAAEQQHQGLYTRNPETPQI